jgi:hypothetical protein
VMGLVLREQKGSKLTIQEMDSNLVYLEGAFINYFDFASGAVTNITTAGEWVKMNTTTTEGFSRNGLAHANNRVTNEGEAGVFKIECIASFIAGNNNEVHLAVFKNGEIVPCSEQETTVRSNDKAQNIPVQCLVEMDENDYVEIWVKNNNATTNITLTNVNVIVTKM